MSTVDERIVRMQFDNRQFEQGVSQTMTTLDRLEDKLQFKNADKSTLAIQKALQNIDLSRIENGIDSLNRKLSVTGIAAMTIVNKMTSSLINAGKQIESATIGQIKTGGWTRAQNIANARFQIKGLKADWDAVYAAADYAVTGTAYGIDAASKAAAQLLASGVDYQKVVEGDSNTMMHIALRSISGVAAMTNSSYEEISHVFTRIAGQGRVMAIDLNSLAARGLNVAADLGKAFGKTEAEIRDMVSKGKIDFQTFAKAMDEAYGEHAKEANETYTGSLSNMRAALSRIGEIFSTPVISHTNRFFLAIKNRIDEIKNTLKAKEWFEYKGLTGDNKLKLVDNIDEFSKWHPDAKLKTFADILDETYEKLIGLGSTLINVLNLDFFTDASRTATRALWNLRNTVDNVQKRIANFVGVDSELLKTTSLTKLIKEREKESTEAKSIITSALSDVQAAFDIWRYGKYGNGQKRVDALTAVGLDPKSVQKIVNEGVKAGNTFEYLTKLKEEAAAAGDKNAEAILAEAEAQAKEEETLKRRRNAFTGISDAIQGIVKGVGLLSDIIGDVVHGGLDAFVDIFGKDKELGGIGKMTKGITNLLTAIADSNFAATAAKHAFEKVFDIFGKTGSTLGTVLSFLADSIHYAVTTDKEVKEMLAPSDEDDSRSKAVRYLGDAFTSLANTLQNVGTIISNIFGGIKKAFFRVFKPDVLAGTVYKVGSMFENLTKRLAESEIPAKLAEAVFTALFTVLQLLVQVMGGVAGAMKTVFNWFARIGKKSSSTTDTLNSMNDAVEDGASAFGGLAGIFDKISDKIMKLPDFFNELKTALSENEGVKRLRDAFHDLNETISRTVSDVLTPTVDALGSINGESNRTAAQKLADYIGWLADKIAWLVELLPVLYGEIKDTLSFAFNIIKKFFNKIKNFLVKEFSQIDVGIIWDKIKDDFVSTFFGDEKLTDKIKNFGKKAGNDLLEAFNSVDWSKVGATSSALLSLGIIYKMFEAMSDFAIMAQNFANVPKSISGMFNAIKGMFFTIQDTMKRASYLAIIGVIAASIVAIGGIIYLLATLPADKLSTAGAIIIIVTAIITLLAVKIFKALAMMGDINRFKVNISLGSLGTAAMITALGLTIYAILKAVRDFNKYVDEIDDMWTVVGSIIAVGVIFVGILVAVALLEKFVKDLSKQTSMLKTDYIVKLTYGLAGMILAMGLTFKFIASACVDIAKMVGTNTDRIWAVAGILVIFMAGVTLIVVALTQMKDGIQLRNIIGVAAAIVAIMLSLGAVFLSVALLATFISGLDLIKQRDAFISARNIMLLSLVSIFALVWAMGDAAGKMSKGGNATASMLAIRAMNLMVAYGVKLLFDCFLELAKIFKEGNDDVIYNLGAAAAVILGSIVVTAIVLNASIRKIASLSVDQSNAVISVLKVVSEFIISFAALVAVIGLSMKLLDGVQISFGMWATIATIMIVLGIMVAGIAFIAKKYFTTYEMVERFSDICLILCKTFVVLGASLALISLSVIGIIASFAGVAKLIETTNIGSIGAAAGLIAGFIIIVTGMLYALMGSLKELPDAPGTMIALGAAFVAIALGIGILALSLEKLANINLKVLLGLGVALVALTAGVGLMLLVVSKMSVTKEKIDILYALAAVLVSIGASFALGGAAVYLMAVGLEKLVGTTDKLEAFSNNIEKVFAVLERHKMLVMTIAIVLGVIAASIAVLAVILATKLGTVIKTFTDLFTKSASKIGDSAKKVGDSVKGGVKKAAEGVSNGLKKTGGGLSKLWKGLSSKLKALIVTGIVAVCSALLESGPVILQTIGQLIMEVIDWLSRLIGPLVGKLIELLINLINGLADAITYNSASIGAALWGVITAIISVIAGFLSSMGTIFQDVPGLGAFISWVAKGFDSVTDAMTKGTKEARENAKATDDARKSALGYSNALEDVIDTSKGSALSLLKTKDSTDEASSSFINLDGGMSSVISKLKDKMGLDGVTDVMKQFTDATNSAADAQDNLNKKLSEGEIKTFKELETKWGLDTKNNPTDNNAITERLRYYKNEVEMGRMDVIDVVNKLQQDIIDISDNDLDVTKVTGGAVRNFFETWSKSFDENAALIKPGQYGTKAIDEMRENGQVWINAYGDMFDVDKLKEIGKKNPNDWVYKQYLAANTPEALAAAARKEEKEEIDRQIAEAQLAAETKRKEAEEWHNALVEKEKAEKAKAEFYAENPTQKIFDDVSAMNSGLTTSGALNAFQKAHPNAVNIDGMFWTKEYLDQLKSVDVNKYIELVRKYNEEKQAAVDEYLEQREKDSQEKELQLIKEAAGSIADLVTDFHGSAFGLLLNPFYGLITGDVQSGWHDISKWIKNKSDERVVSAFEKSLTDDDNIGKIQDASQDGLINPITNKITDTDTRDTMVKNGEYIAQGLAEGMIDQASTDNLVTAGKIMVDTVSGAARDQAGIHSPSTLFMSYGAYIVQGLANGITENAKLASDAATSMVDAVSGSFNSSLDYISKMASGELEYDPTIRPVLDSSGVGYSVDRMNALFRGQTVNLAGYTGALTADIGKLDGTNAAIVSQLRELRGDFDTLGNKMSRLKVVMNSGALVGSIAGDMDSALGKRQIRRGRGI